MPFDDGYSHNRFTYPYLISRLVHNSGITQRVRQQTHCRSLGTSSLHPNGKIHRKQPPSRWKSLRQVVTQNLAITGSIHNTNKCVRYLPEILCASFIIIDRHCNADSGDVCRDFAEIYDNLLIIPVSLTCSVVSGMS